jgi:hypothetical protein
MNSIRAFLHLLSVHKDAFVALGSIMSGSVAGIAIGVAIWTNNRQLTAQVRATQRKEDLAAFRNDMSRIMALLVEASSASTSDEDCRALLREIMLLKYRITFLADTAGKDDGLLGNQIADAVEIIFVSHQERLANGDRLLKKLHDIGATTLRILDRERKLIARSR